jgi:predicted O-methyltransferase YrrM
MHKLNEFIRDTDNETSINSVLKFFEGRYSTSKHLLVLYSIGIGINAKTIIEIGSGRSTLALCAVSEKTDGKVTSCDTDNMKEIAHPNLTKVKMNGLDFLRDVKPESVDLVFLDCLSSPDVKPHKAEKYVDESLRVLRNNGCLCVHDVGITDYTISKVWADRGYFFFPYNYTLGVVFKNVSYEVAADAWTKSENTK